MKTTNRRPRSLAYQLMKHFSLYMAVLIVLALPLLYFITTHYYAEDLTRIVMKYGVAHNHIDLKEDTLTGMFIQFLSIIVMVVVAVFIVMRYVPNRLWRPFRQTMKRIRSFHVETGVVPQLEASNVTEFNELNHILTELMTNTTKSYRLQKEFTENASHELQTPLAIAQMKIDALQQDPNLTDRQASDLQDIYIQLRRMSRLSRSLLMLSKIENNQFQKNDKVNINDFVRKFLPQWESISGDRKIEIEEHGSQTITCNEVLLESLLTNLVVNAIRHSQPSATVTIQLRPGAIVVSNDALEGSLNKEHIFNRFYHSADSHKGYGLGLSIVKSICTFHGWTVDYRFEGGRHEFIVNRMHEDTLPLSAENH